jgi:hypothetical protein
MQAQAVVPVTRGDGRRALVLLVCGVLLLVIGIVGLFSLQGKAVRFDAAYDAHGENIHFLMVNVTSGRESRESAQSFLDEEGYTFPVYYDTDLDAAMQYAVSSIPMTFFIGDDGIVVAYAVGAIDGDTIQRGIDMIFEE